MKEKTFTHEFEFTPGDKVKEKVTGFTGVITGAVFYLTGCNQFLVVAKSKHNKEAIATWYDGPRLTLLKRQVIEPEDVQGKDPGPDRLPDIGRRGV
jgi:hypothetical protein